MTTHHDDYVGTSVKGNVYRDGSGNQYVVPFDDEYSDPWRYVRNIDAPLDTDTPLPPFTGLHYLGK